MKRNNKCTPIILSICTLSLLLCGCASAEQKSAYKNALAYHKSGDLEHAVEQFTIAEDYKDSEEKLESIYSAAIEQFNNGDYENALKSLTALSNHSYKDSASYVEQCNHMIICTQAEEQYENKDTSNACALLTPILDTCPEAKELYNTIIKDCYDDTTLMKLEILAKDTTFSQEREELEDRIVYRYSFEQYDDLIAVHESLLEIVNNYETENSDNPLISNYILPTGETIGITVLSLDINATGNHLLNILVYK